MRIPRRRFPQSGLVQFTLVAVLVFAPIHAASTQPARSVSPTSSGAERLLRSWQDTVKIHGRDQARTIEVVYDSVAGVALRRTYDADGSLLFEQPLASQPQPSREEIEEAFAMVRNDEALGALARMADAQIDGGFILDEAEGEPCGRGTRCIQVFMLSQSRWGLLRHSAVDMRNQRIAHRSYRTDRADQR